MYKLRTSEYRIGIVGLYYSGKTVLLTSLINHLRDQDPGRFQLGKKDATLRKFTELPSDEGWSRFNYRAHREMLVHERRWPVKTTDRSQYVCEFERSDWRANKVKLKVFDMPGERVADAIMAGTNYAAWSDHMVDLLRTDKEYRDCCGEFHDLLESRRQSPPDDLLHVYRLGLALILAYKPFISPSTFFLDTQGQMISVHTADGKGLSPEEIASGRHVGLAPDCQFAPLPEAWRQARPDVAKLFAERYDRYKAKVVFPLISTLKSCHALIFLVDVITLLGSGPGMYNDNKLILQDLLEVLDPGQTVLGKTLRGAAAVFLPHGWRPGRITRIAFVALKLDLVYPDDRGKMIDLVQRFAEPAARNHDGLTFKCFNCSAVVSTKAFRGDDGVKYLTGLVKSEEKKFAVSELPSDWPGDWQPGQYVFPQVRPRLPPQKDRPPEQINLDKLLNFMFGEKD